MQYMMEFKKPRLILK